MMILVRELTILLSMIIYSFSCSYLVVILFSSLLMLLSCTSDGSFRVQALLGHFTLIWSSLRKSRIVVFCFIIDQIYSFRLFWVFYLSIFCLLIPIIIVIIWFILIFRFLPDDCQCALDILKVSLYLILSLFICVRS
jgi:hypothetical protein